MNKRFATLTIAIAMVALFVLSARYFSQSENAVRFNPRVVDLRDAGFNTWYRFADLSLCGPDATRCEASSQDFPAGWASAHLPGTELRDLPNYPGVKTEEKKNVIFYLFRLDRSIHVSPEMRDHDLAFSPYYVNHHHFYVYVNGSLRNVYSGDAPMSVPIVSISTQDWNKDNHVDVLIAAKILANDRGIVHFGSMYTGPTDVLAALQTTNERMNVSYYLLFMVAKGSVLWLFLVLSLWVPAYRGQASFLLFAGLSFFEEWIRSNVFYFTDALSVKAQLFFVVRSLLMFALYRLLASYLRKSSLKISSVIAIACLGVAMFVMWDANQSLDGIPNIMRALELSTMLAIVICLVHLVEEFIQARHFIFDFKFFMITMYLVFLGSELWFVPFSGFEMRSAADLLFFAWIAVQEGMRLTRSYADNERLKINLEQAQLEASVGKLSQILAHEVRKPFYLLRNWMDLRGNTKDSASQIGDELENQFRKELQHSLNQVDALVDDVLITTKRSAPHGELSTQCDLVELVKNALHNLPCYSEHPQRFHLHMPKQLMASVEANRITRLIQNLAENAWDAAAKEPTYGIHLHLELKDSKVILKIANDGVTIDPKDLEKIFEPGYTNKQRGTGLGLAIVRKIARDHLGDVHATIEDGKTIFTVFLLTR